MLLFLPFSLTFREEPVLFVLRQHLSLRGGGAADRTAAAVCFVDFRRGLRDEMDVRRHRGRHRYAQNPSGFDALPFAERVQRMHHRQLIFAIEGFRYLAGRGAQRPDAISAEVRGELIEDANHDLSPPVHMFCILTAFSNSARRLLSLHPHPS